MSYVPPVIGQVEEESKEIHEGDKIKETEEVEAQGIAPIDIDNYTPEDEREHEEKMERIRQRKTDPTAMWKKLEKGWGTKEEPRA